jgi:hypothetical protein
MMKEDFSLSCILIGNLHLVNANGMLGCRLPVWP